MKKDNKIGKIHKQNIIEIWNQEIHQITFQVGSLDYILSLVLFCSPPFLPTTCPSPIAQPGKIGALQQLQKRSLMAKSLYWVGNGKIII